MAAFQEMAHDWAAAGITPLPFTPNGKKPMVKRPDRFGQRAALSLVPKFPTANLGFLAGRRNGVTVVDIDSTKDSELDYVLETCGDSPLIVQTPGGGWHVYYSHDGEGRHIKPDNDHPIDTLGDGPVVAPPSTKPDGRRYGWLRGGLADVRNLPTMRAGAIQKLVPAPLKLDVGIPISTAPNAATIEQGTRNVGFLRVVVALAHEVTSKADLLAQSREANAALCKPPLSEVEVLGAVGSAWRYKEQGTLMGRCMESAIILPRASLSSLLAAGETDAWALLGLFRDAHGATPGKLFAASPAAMERDRCIGAWDKHRYRNGIRKLCDLGELEQVYGGGWARTTRPSIGCARSLRGANRPPILIRYSPLCPPVLGRESESGIFAGSRADGRRCRRTAATVNGARDQALAHHDGRQDDSHDRGSLPGD